MSEFLDPVPWFPQNVVDAMAPIFDAVEGVDLVVMRDIHPDDPSNTLGIMVVDTEPLEYEMGGTPSAEASITQHNYFLRYYVKDTDFERGRRDVNSVSRTLRLMLAYDQPLRVALAALSHFDSAYERIERIHRWGVGRQRLSDANIDGSFVAASGTEFFVQTETIQGF